MKRYSQQDPLWKNKTLGVGECTIGGFGCFLTCFAMLAEVDPLTLNDKLVDISGFSGSLLMPYFIPDVTDLVIGNPVDCQNIPAPLSVIDDALASGLSVIVGIDTSPDPAIQWHYVILTGKVGNDYSMVDPWPLVDNPPATLLGRYGKGRDAKTIITYILTVDAGTHEITSTVKTITSCWLRSAPVVSEASKVVLLPAGKVLPAGTVVSGDGREWEKMELYVAKECIK